MSEASEITRINGALSQIATATTDAGTAGVGIATRLDAQAQTIRDLLAAGAEDSTGALAQTASNIEAEAVRVRALADFLTPLGNDSNDPIPVPPPDPTIP